MSLILAIETSSELASAALLQGDRMLYRAAPAAQTHSHTILPLIQGLLAEAGVALAQCDAIGFGSGPGSFTGVRTACGIAQGLAFGADVPLVPVVTLQAMAQSCRSAHGDDDVLAVLDARMGEVYWAQYRYRPGDGWQVVIAPTLSAPAAVNPQGAVRACGNGLAAYAEAFAGAAFMRDALTGLMPQADAVAQLARMGLAAGQAIAAADAQPLYLRNKIALTIDERLAKAAS
jgi:tRNA threonylcarbamoyladenosine biosynthesis protein TsaB